MSNKKNQNQQQYQNHPSNPAAQPFQMAGNHTSKKGWWTKGKSSRG